MNTKKWREIHKILTKLRENLSTECLLIFAPLSLFRMNSIDKEIFILCVQYSNIGYCLSKVQKRTKKMKSLIHNQQAVMRNKSV